VAVDACVGAGVRVAVAFVGWRGRCDCRGAAGLCAGAFLSALLALSTFVDRAVSKGAEEATPGELDRPFDLGGIDAVFERELVGGEGWELFAAAWVLRALVGVFGEVGGVVEPGLGGGAEAGGVDVGDGEVERPGVGAVAAGVPHRRRL
jgi:hypothetical protein